MIELVDTILSRMCQKVNYKYLLTTDPLKKVTSKTMKQINCNLSFENSPKNITQSNIVLYCRSLVETYP